jgi:hypothetical protein
MAYTDIDKPSDYFETVTYAGGTTDISSLDFQPDFVWGKKRTGVENHALFDSVRGATKTLNSNTNAAESTRSGSLTSFDSDGFTMGGSDGIISASGNNYVAWNWKAGTSFTNDASATGIGSIDSAGSFNNDSGFSIVSWTGTGSAGTIKHGLSTAPSMMIVKERDNANDWKVYHHSIGNGKSLRLDTSAAQGDDSTAWNSTTPTSSVFSVGTSNAVNRNGGDIIAYCFSEVKNYSKISSYIGNGNVNGSYIHLGFSPAFLLIRRVSPGTSWQIQDNKRSNGGQNINEDSMFPDTSGAEGGGKGIDHLANGFKLRSTSGANNSSGHTFIYYAVSEHPFVTSPDNGSVPATAR